ncbi:hypothetical protein N7510_005381 [Penicillium lagena]|uniref:uncharacterized protein n=1 Tax=Penicillium lagena TaxID=94218 RepID=UPI002540A745|nr:uncharacterized protein N7510_005381 [Penicillium lagena]KAJ5612187.1 hypothetical protein N7510_005381 [Penicillium lagena]
MKISKIATLFTWLLVSVQAAPIKDTTEIIDGGEFTSSASIWASYGYDDKKKRDDSTELIDGGEFTSTAAIWASYGYDD